MTKVKIFFEWFLGKIPGGKLVFLFFCVSYNFRVLSDCFSVFSITFELCDLLSLFLEEIDLYFGVNGTIKLPIEEFYIEKFHNDDNIGLPHSAKITKSLVFRPNPYRIRVRLCFESKYFLGLNFQTIEKKVYESIRDSYRIPK